jgi:hypothetical protein
MIIRVRDRLLRAARDLMEGTEPSLPHKPELFRAPTKQTYLKPDESIEPLIVSHREPAAMAAAGD